MALYLSENFKKSLDKPNIKINVILDIEGFSTFSSTGFSELLKFDEGLFFDEGFSFDEIQINPFANKNINSLIQLEGTSNQIKQNVRIDKGIEGTKTFDISLLDENNRISRIFTAGNTVDEVIGRKAKVYFSLDNLVHPNDSVLFLDGFITRLRFKNNGTVVATVEHSIGNTRKEAFTPTTTNLTNQLVQGSTQNITVDSTDNILGPSRDNFELYVKIDDEIIKYTTTNNGQLTGITRAQFGTTDANHDAGASVETMLRITGNPFDRALNLLLGSGGFAEELTVLATGQVTSTTFVSDALLIQSYDIEKEFGITIGDIILGTVNGSLIFEKRITNIVKLEDGNSYIQVQGENFASVTGLTDTIKVKSNYDIFGHPFNNIGAKLSYRSVDTKSFTRIKDEFYFAPNIDILISDNIEYLDFIQNEIFKPLGVYFKTGARISVKQHLPPLYTSQVKVFDENNIVNPNTITSDRSINKYYYNSVIYSYDKDPISDKFLRKNIVIDSDSVEKFKVGLRPYRIESSAYKNSSDIVNTIKYISNLLLARYNNASEVFSVTCQFNTIDVDVEDSVFLNGTNIYDINTGERGVSNKLCEVINKSVNLKSGLVTYTLLDATAYKAKGRFGVVAPASKVSNINTQRVIIEQNFGNQGVESEKYTDLIGQTFKIYTEDYSHEEEAVVSNIDYQNNILYFQNSLSTVFWPGNKDIFITVANYDQTSADANKLSKEMFCYVNPTVQVAARVSDTEFNVDVADFNKLFVGAIVQFRNSDNSVVNNTKIKALKSGFIWELEEGHTLANTDYIEKIGFSGDNGKPYVIT